MEDIDFLFLSVDNEKAVDWYTENKTMAERRCCIFVLACVCTQVIGTNILASKSELVLVVSYLLVCTQFFSAMTHYKHWYIYIEWFRQSKRETGGEQHVWCPSVEMLPHSLIWSFHRSGLYTLTDHFIKYTWTI